MLRLGLLILFLFSGLLAGAQKSVLETYSTSDGVVSQSFEISSTVFSETNKDKSPVFYVSLSVKPARPDGFRDKGRVFYEEDLRAGAFGNLTLYRAVFDVLVVYDGDTTRLFYPYKAERVAIPGIPDTAGADDIEVVVSAAREMIYAGTSRVQQAIREKLAKEKYAKERQARMKPKPGSPKKNQATVMSPPPPPPPPPDASFGGGRANPAAHKEATTARIGGTPTTNVQKGNETNSVAAPVTEAMEGLAQPAGEVSSFVRSMASQLFAFIQWARRLFP